MSDTSDTGYLHRPFSSEVVERYRRIQRELDQLDPRTRPWAALVSGYTPPTGNIIVFPGSYNPPTNAHLAMLHQARQFGNQRHASHAYQVYAAFSKRTTDKETVERPLLVDRIMLLEETLKGQLPEAGILLFNRGLYVEQAEGVRAAFPGVETLYFLIGFDKIVQIFDARYYSDRDAALRELFRLADVLVAPRAGEGAKELHELLTKPENRQFGEHVHALPLPETFAQMSSTLIRREFEAHTRDVPPQVSNFIRETCAYEPEVRLPNGSIIDRYGERVNYIEEITSGSA